MISYAQNREDVLLNRVFSGERGGFYVDVGAGHPWLDSVTQHFSEQGWHGINIEPRPAMYELLVRHRPRDINLHCCLSNQTGEQTFYQVDFPGIRELGFDEGGLSTLDAQVAEGYRREGIPVRECAVPVRTLTEVCLKQRVGQIDFLKIDVEGHERHVLEGTDLRQFRPRILIIEATRPRSPQPCHQEWEMVVLKADYLFATFDGLNRYYVRAEEQALVECFQTPVNVLDDYITHQVAQRDQQIAELKRQVRKFRKAWLPPRFTQLFRRRVAG